MGCSIRGRFWRNGDDVSAEIPAIKLVSSGNSVKTSIEALKSTLEDLCQSPVMIEFTEGNCFVVSGEDSYKFENFLLTRIEKTMHSDVV